MHTPVSRSGRTAARSQTSSVLRQCRAYVAVVAALVWTNGAHTTELQPGDNAIDVNQVDFRGSAVNSTLGQLTVNIPNANAAASLSSGYVNVADSSGNWLVRNLPLFGSSIYDNPTITVNFDLGVNDGTRVSTKDLHVDYSSAPVAAFTGGTASTFTIGKTGLAQGGFEGALSSYLGTANPGLVSYINGGQTSIVYQKNHPNQQTANNQCAPMAVANSLTWLKDTHGVPVPDPNDIGLKGDGTLVGKLDSLMERGVRTRANGDPVFPDQILTGKLSYISNAGLAGKVITKHQGDLGNENFAGPNGLTSFANGTTVDISFIISELEHGEDVEMVYSFAGGGGHLVDITGAGFILGVPWITYVSDHEQTDTDPTDTKGTGLVDFSFLDGNILVNEPGQPRMAFVVTESIPEPSTLVLMLMGLGLLVVAARRIRERL